MESSLKTTFFFCGLPSHGVPIYNYLGRTTSTIWSNQKNSEKSHWQFDLQMTVNKVQKWNIFRVVRQGFGGWAGWGSIIDELRTCLCNGLYMRGHDFIFRKLVLIRKSVWCPTTQLQDTLVNWYAIVINMGGINDNNILISVLRITNTCSWCSYTAWRSGGGTQWGKRIFEKTC